MGDRVCTRLVDLHVVSNPPWGTNEGRRVELIVGVATHDEDPARLSHMAIHTGRLGNAKGDPWTPSVSSNPQPMEVHAAIGP